MAAVRSLIRRTIHLPTFSEWTSTFRTIRCYSVFPKRYIEPTYLKDEQGKLFQSSEGKLMAQKFIKPAFTNQTSSEFHNTLVQKFINMIMRKGQKSLARTLLEDTFAHIKMKQLRDYNHASEERKKDIELDPIVILQRAIENSTPLLQLQGVKKGGILYQVPSPITEAKSQFMAMKWLIQSAKEKEKNIRFSFVLAKELIDAAHNKGRVIKKKQDLHKQCEANRAYAHYRWT